MKDISTRVCPICKSSLSTYFHINIKKQIQRIFSEITVNERSHSNNTSVLKDISDGRIYKKALNEEKSTRSSIFTFSIKTDGISLCERSQLGVWPLYGVCNEISIDKRFCPENLKLIFGKFVLSKLLMHYFSIVLCLSVGSIKPNFDVFLNPILCELKELEYGIGIKEKICKFFVISGVYDRPARATVLNMIGSTGFFGCLKCYQPGSTLKTSNGI